MTNSRIYTFQLIYEYVFQGEYNQITLDNIIKDNNSLNQYDIKYIKKVYSGVIKEYETLIKIIEKYTLNFSLERIFKADIALLLLAIYEMKFMPKIPLKVTINEVLEISKTFSTKKSFNYINGILAKVYKEVENDN